MQEEVEICRGEHVQDRQDLDLTWTFTWHFLLSDSQFFQKFDFVIIFFKNFILTVKVLFSLCIYIMRSSITNPNKRNDKKVTTSFCHAW